MANDISPEIEALLAGREDLAAYALAQIPHYEIARHHQVIIDHLHALERGEFKNLMIFAPPRHGKSELSTVLLPAWWLGRHPGKEVMQSAYNQELIEDFSQKARMCMESDYHRAIFPECEIDERWNAKHDFRTTRGGALRAVGRGGSATGRGADLYLIDDCIKDRKEAESPAVQKDLRDWFTDVVVLRRQPDSRMVIINTRWSPNDLCGWLLEQGIIKWKVLSLAGLGFWQPDGTRVPDEGGDPLWPTRFPRDFLEEQRAVRKRDSWLALYQQIPTIAGDERIFEDDWFQLFAPRTDKGDLRLMNGLIIGDPASKKKKSSDFTVIWVIGMAADRNYYFVDGICDRLGLSDRWTALKTLHQRWNPIFKNLRVFWEQIGNADQEYFEQRMKGGTLVEGKEGQHPDAPYRFYVEPIGSTAVNKLERIRDFGTGVCKDRRVYFNETIWCQTAGKKVNLTKDLFEQEWSRYPALEHDDRLDAASYIRDKKVGETFPVASKNSNLTAMMESWKERRKNTSWMGQ